MSASQLVSSEWGGASQPAGGGLSLQIVLRRTIRRAGLKPVDDTEEGVAGYSLLHCTELTIPSFRNDWSVECAGLRFKILRRSEGGIILSNVSLRTCEPTLTRRQHNRA